MRGNCETLKFLPMYTMILEDMKLKADRVELLERQCERSLCRGCVEPGGI